MTRSVVTALSQRRIRSAFSRRFRQSFARAVALGLPRPVLVPCSMEPGGLQLALDVREKVQQGMAIHRRYETFTTRQLQTLLRPGDLFVDVGAHVGYFSLVAARLVGPGGCVAAFEPNPANRALLLHNVDLNGIKNIEVHPFALADRAGRAVLHLNPFNEGGGRLTPFQQFPDGRLRWTRNQASRLFGVLMLEVAVDARPLQELTYLLPAGRRVAAVKIDVEEEELSVLRGMNQILTRDRPWVVLEIAPKNVQVVTAFLQSLRYQITDHDGGLNWLFVHPSNAATVA